MSADPSAPTRPGGAEDGPVVREAHTPFEDLPLRLRIGKLLDELGQVLFPLGLGAAAGFYASDRGVPLLPTMLGSLLSLGLFALLLMVVGRILRGRGFVDTRRGTKMRKRVVAGLVLAVLAVVGRLAVHEAAEDSPLSVLSPADFDAAFDIDAAQYKELDDGLEHLVRLTETEAWLADGDDVLTADQEAMVLDAFSSAYDHVVGLDRIRSFYEDWYRIDPSRTGRSRHMRAFLLAYSAELALYEKSVRASRVLLANDNVKKFLDAPHPSRGLPPASFSRMRRELHGSEAQARVVAGEQYLRALQLGVGGREEAARYGAGWLWDEAHQHLAVIDAVAPIERGSLQLRSDAQVFKKAMRRVWYPTQKGVAEGMGDTRTRRIGWYLVGEEQLEEVQPDARPGDVLLSRKNWYLSNVGLPGFWPHALIYLGEPEVFRAYFDDPEVTAWVTELSGEPQRLDQYLASRYPSRWLAYVSGELDDAHVGDAEAEPTPHVIIEAISEGVVFSTMAHAAGDYLVAMRPRVGKLAKAQAMVQAFSDHGKPYDFTFDFASDHALVCTELVWRAYRPAEGKEGLELPLITVAGRRTLPANELARLYAEQADADDRAFDFVFFIDGSEADQRAFVSDEASFRETWQRVKWDQAQQ